MSSSPPPKGSAHQDVMQYAQTKRFLQDLDTLNITEKSTSPVPAASKPDGKAAQDVLSFLDELTTVPSASTTSSKAATSPAKPQSRQPSKQEVDNLPSASQLFGSEGSASSEQSSLQQPSSVVSGKGYQSVRAEPSKPKSAEPPKTPEQQEEGSWSWNSLWSQAQATASKVTAATATSLTMAQHMVEDAAKVVTSDKVKGIVANVSKDLTDSVAGVVKNETVQKYGSDLSKFTMSSVSTISDILAPPITPPGTLRKSPAGMFAKTVTLWLCAQPFDPSGPADGYPTHDQVHDFVQATGNTLWITDKPGQGICSKLTVNGVANPDPKPAKGLQEAIQIVEQTLQKLSKFAEGKKDEVAQEAKPEASEEKRVFLVVQPFITLMASQLFGAAPHIQFFVLLICPAVTSETDAEKEKENAAKVVSVVSQSVRVDSDGVDPHSAWARWGKDQTARVIETAITDVFEEFAVKCQVYVTDV
ncbi:hypothetical protein HDU97_009945 [Phlyctochytrium planicorne]|nr:hypothetical protein HDU97_009945 [Phlyctochytrium planicorne]